jgi:hypothetical protein
MTLKISCQDLSNLGSNFICQLEDGHSVVQIKDNLRQNQDFEFAKF